ncbi:MAG TPA: hypothetical protein VIW29_20795 [Polyangiaceae bacterium]
MKSLRFLVPVLGLVGSLVVACSDDDDPIVDGEAGAGGQAPTEPGAAGAGQGGADAAAGAAGACATDGTGTLVLQVIGLPDDVAPDVLFDGPSDYAVEEAGSLEGVDSGEYSVTAARVFDADPIVRTVYDAVVTAPDFCLADGASHTVKVTYTAIGSSNKLWMPTGVDGPELAGFASADLAETAIVSPEVAIDGTGVGAVAFDRDGNLWAAGAIIGAPQLVRFPASELAESGTLEPDISITLAVSDVPCFPAIKRFAFDPEGNLWHSSNCDGTPGIQRIDAADLTTSGEKESSVLITEVDANHGIAFDKDGNLWVAGGAVLRRFDAARLDLSDTDPPDLTLAVSTAPPDNSMLEGSELAFDKGGNLWGVAGSTIFQLAAADLDQTGAQDVKANVSFAIDVLALPGTPAFDDGDGLWIDLAEGELGRFSPEQLGTSSGPGAPVTPDTLISSASVNTELPFAFFPAPAGLPLYHSIPE